MRRGELYRVYKPGGDPKRHRVFLVVSRASVLESRFSSVICAPVFSDGQGLSTQVPVGIDEGLKHASWIMCDNLVSIPKRDLTQFIGMLGTAKISEVNRALAAALGLL